MPITLDEFVQSITASGLMDAEEIQSFLDTLPMAQQPKTAEELAREMHRAGKLTRFQAQAIYQKKTRGLVVGNYVVLDKLGKGGMGAVYKARHRRMDRIVALKMLPSTATRSSDAVKRFQQEVRAAAKLSHPNIVTAHDADEAKGVHFLVMEYVEGRDLHAFVKDKGTLSVARAVDYVVQTAKGLEYAHSQGIIHRDIKPHNLLLDKKGTVKILDMGLARIEEAVAGRDATADEGLTQSGQVMGTLDYMPPEQALDTKTVDVRADIYSLGCTLYYLLIGRPPYSGDTVGKKIVAHREDPIPSLRGLRGDVPQSLDTVFRRMLAKRPEERQQSMTDVISELQGCTVQGPGAPASFPPISGSYSETVDLLQEDTKPPAQLPSPLDELFASEPVQITERLVAPSRRYGKRWTKRQKTVVAAVAGGVAFILLLLGIILKLRTSEGTLVVEISEPDATVQVLDEQGKVVIERKGTKGALTIGVDPGKRRLRVAKDGFEVFAKELSIASGGKETINVKLEPKLDFANVQPAQPSPTTAPVEPPSASPDKPLQPSGSAVVPLVDKRSTPWQDLFDGKTLDGWRVDGAATWTVSDNAIHSGGEGSGMLLSRREFGDFELQADVKINSAGNSGVFFRITPEAKTFLKQYEVQIIGSEMRRAGGYPHTGDIFGFAKVPENYIQDDRWFHLHLIASGNHILVKIDGKGVLDYVDTQNSFTRGPVGFQRLDPPTRVSYRNIRVKESDGARSSGTASSFPNAVGRPESSEKGFVSLFDGKTLDGWHTNGAGRWSVENGSIVGRLSKQKNWTFGHLISDAEYDDFDLRMKFRLQGNSGVYVRGQEVGTDGMLGLQVDLYTPKGIGCLVELLAHPSTVGVRVPNPENRVPEYFRADDWNDLSVRVLDKEVTCQVNGFKTAEVLNYTTRRKGVVALQLFGICDTEVGFKEIRLRSLPTAGAGGLSAPAAGEQAGPTRPSDAPGPPLPSFGPAPSSGQFAYVGFATFGPAKVIEELAPYTNIVVDEYYDETPEKVRAKSADVFPNWRAKAKGRPVLRQWCCWAGESRGLVPQCIP
jgi:serine/threonine protein kinase